MIRLNQVRRNWLTFGKIWSSVVPAKVIGGYKVLGRGMIFLELGSNCHQIWSVVPMKDLDPGKAYSNDMKLLQRVMSAFPV